MNTKGIKFLAVLAVLAMAFAAFAVIAPAQENDADAVFDTDCLGSDVDHTALTITGGAEDFYVSKNAAVTATLANAKYTFSGYLPLAYNTTVVGDGTGSADTTWGAMWGAGYNGTNGYIWWGHDFANGTKVYGTKTINGQTTALKWAGQATSVESPYTYAGADGGVLIAVEPGAIFTYNISTDEGVSYTAITLDFTNLTSRDQVKAEVITSTTVLAASKVYYLPKAITTHSTTAVDYASIFYLENGAAIKTSAAPDIYSGEVLTLTTDYALIKDDATLRVTTAKANEVYTMGDKSISVPTASTAEVTFGTKAINEGTENDFTVWYANGAIISADLPIVTSLTVSANTTITVEEGVTIGSATMDIASAEATSNIYAYGNVVTKLTALSDKDAKVFVGPKGSFTSSANYTVNNVVNTLEGGADPQISGTPTSDSVTDAILSGNLTIPEDTVFTVKGSLGLNGYALIVNGTLVVEANGVVYATGVNKDAKNEGIYLGDFGSIDSTGAIGIATPIKIYNNKTPTQFITVKGAAVGEISVQREVVADVASYYLAVGGTAKLLSGVNAGIITLNGARITSDMTIPTQVTLALGTDVTLADGNVLKINGTITGAHFVVIKNGASVEINGLTNNGAETKFKADTKKIDYQGTVSEATTQPYVEITEGANAYVSGLIISVGKETVAGTSAATTYTYQRMYLEGDVKNAATGVEIPAASTIKIYSSTYGDTTKTNTVYVKAGTEFNLAAGVSVLGNASDVLVMNGSMISKAAAGANLTILGARYDVTLTGAGETTTYIYGTLKEVMEYIEIADGKKVIATVTTISDDLTIEVGQTLQIATGTVIASEVTVAGTISTGTIANVTGVLTIMKNANCPKPIAYDVKTTLEDGTVIYSSVAKAIKSATPGSTITVGEATSSTDVTVPAGVTVEVATSYTLKKNFVISEDATVVLKSGAALNLEGGATALLTVDGTLDASKGAVTVATAMLASNMTFKGIGMFQSPIAKYTGASFTDSDGTFVVTNAADAVALAALADNKLVTLNGTFSESEDVLSYEVNIALADGADVTLGNVFVDGAYVNAPAGTKLTAKISAETGDADAVISVSKITNFKVTDVKTTSGTGDVSYKVNIEGDASNGSIAITAGTVNVGANMAVTAGFLVGANATLVNGGTTAYNLDLQGANQAEIAGKLTVSNGSTVTFTSAKSLVSGTLEVKKSSTGTKGIVDVKTLTITGTVNATDGTFQTANAGDAKLIIGTEPTSLGAGIATFIGNIKLQQNKAFLVYAGADVSEMTVDAAGDVDNAVFTDFVINGFKYMTAFASSTHGGNVADVIGYPSYKITGVQVPAAGANDLKHLAGWGLAADPHIGGDEPVATELAIQTVNVRYSVGTGITLIVDGVIVNGNEDLEVGTHTVSASLEPGYTGTFQITFNGKAVTDGKITITSADAGKKLVLSATGDVQPVQPEPSPEQKESFGITEILLVVLIILIAVMVIVVIMRMNRS